MTDIPILKHLYDLIEVDPVLNDGALLAIQELPIDRMLFIAEIIMLVKAIEKNAKDERTLSGVFYTEANHRELVKDPYVELFTQYDEKFVSINEDKLKEVFTK